MERHRKEPRTCERRQGGDERIPGTSCRRNNLFGRNCGIGGLVSVVSAGYSHRRAVPPASGQADAIPNVRLILATNADLRKKVDEGVFRNDLYQRIAAPAITIPPLRDRKEDIPLFVEKMRKDHKAKPEFLLALLRHDWADGNVRELEICIDLAIGSTRSDESLLDLEVLRDLPTITGDRTLKKQQCEDEMYSDFERFAGGARRGDT